MIVIIECTIWLQSAPWPMGSLSTNDSSLREWLRRDNTNQTQLSGTVHCWLSSVSWTWFARNVVITIRQIGLLSARNDGTISDTFYLSVSTAAVVEGPESMFQSWRLDAVYSGEVWLNSVHTSLRCLRVIHLHTCRKPRDWKVIVWRLKLRSKY